MLHCCSASTWPWLQSAEIGMQCGMLDWYAFCICNTVPVLCGFCCRLFQPHPKQLAARHAVVSTGGDDLQTQLLLRDQLQAVPQPQHHSQAHTTHHAQQVGEQHQAYIQDRSGSSLSAAMSATGASLHTHAMMQQQQARPATLSKAVAGVLANAKDWKERVDKMTALAEALNRQVGCCVGPPTWSQQRYVSFSLQQGMVVCDYCVVHFSCTHFGQFSPCIVPGCDVCCSWRLTPGRRLLLTWRKWCPS